MSAVMSMSAAAPARVVAAQRGASAAGQSRPAFLGRAAASSKAPLADAFNAMALTAPARKQAQRGLSICGASSADCATDVYIDRATRLGRKHVGSRRRAVVDDAFPAEGKSEKISTPQDPTPCSGW